MDNQRDFYIKEILQKDDLISKKADDVFNNFLKGEIKMNEAENKQEKVVDINKQKNNKIQRKKILTAVASLMIVFVAANAYAATQGYNNIFFIIKNLVSTEVITDRNEILSDKDITISYQPIEVSKNLKIQINKLIVKENKATLIIKLDEEYPLEYYPAEYCVYDVTDGRKDILGKKENSADRGNNTESSSYVESINLEQFKNDTKKIQLEVLDKNKESITILEIDLENQEIEILNSRNVGFEKISETELKEVLGEYANFLSYNSFNAGDFLTKEEFLKEKLVEQAMLKLLEKDDYETRSSNEYSVKEVHTAIEELCGIYYKEPIELEYSLIYYDKEKDCYSWDNGDGLGSALCLDITDISFQNGIYTVEFVYCFAGELSYIENEIENLDKFKATLELSINEEYEYFKYRIINFGEADGDSYYIEEYEDNASSDITVPDNSSNNSSNNNSNPDSGAIDNIDNNIGKESNNSDSGYVEAPIDSKVDNYASTMDWITLYTPGLKTKVPAIWDVNVIKDIYTGQEDEGKIATSVFGLARGIDKETNKIIDSNVTINFYMPEFVNCSTLEEFTAMVADRLDGEDTGSGYGDFEGNTTWALVISGDHDYYCHYEPLNDGYEGIGYIVEVTCDNYENYKVTNILNWIFGDITTTSF